jgi:adenine-specific DNA glycosylase
MLSKILEICNDAPQGADLNEIAGKLYKDPAVAEGMVNHLLRMGKLVECAQGPICEMCPGRRSCILLKSSGKVFVSISAVKEYNRGCQELQVRLMEPTE